MSSAHDVSIFVYVTDCTNKTVDAVIEAEIDDPGNRIDVIAAATTFQKFSFYTFQSVNYSFANCYDERSDGHGSKVIS